ncbi:MAG: TIGR01212 family radical SAM protein [Deltaproteobacteria bacterium]|nr:TIGR01212 family radical SAM protein [Deltaproteobacteria bacterium]
MEKRYLNLNSYFKTLFGHRVHKIAVDAGFTCPNRDGKISFYGCIYCNAQGSGTGAKAKGISITEQLITGKKKIAKRFKAKKFLAYFQSYTNTYAPFDILKKHYDEALSVKDIAGLSIGTRPDCINEQILSLLEEYAKKKLIWIEYGLQSSKNKTLNLINRGHNFKTFQQAVQLTKNRGIKICAHVIIGLPQETKKDMIDTAKAVAVLEIDGIKFHSLYVIKGTELERLYKNGKYTPISMEEYVDVLCDFIQLLPPQTVIQRLTSDPHPKEIIAPLWCLEKLKTVNLIKARMEAFNMRQGENGLTNKIEN